MVRTRAAPFHRRTWKLRATRPHLDARQLCARGPRTPVLAVGLAGLGAKSLLVEPPDQRPWRFRGLSRPPRPTPVTRGRALALAHPLSRLAHGVQDGPHAHQARVRPQRRPSRTALAFAGPRC